MKTIFIAIIILLTSVIVSCENLGHEAINDLELGYVAPVGPTEQTVPTGPTGPLIYYYKFDKADNLVALDSSGNDLHGTIDAISVVIGKVGNAFNFTNGAVTIPTYDFDIDNKISIELWLKNNDAHAYIYTSFFSKLESSFTSNKLELTINNKLVIESNSQIPEGEWCYIAVTYSGSEAKCYINGLLDNENNIYIAIPSNPFDSQIGGSFGFDGEIDEFKIHNTVRTPQEIEQYYAETNSKYLISD